MLADLIAAGRVDASWERVLRPVESDLKRAFAAAEAERAAGVEVVPKSYAVFRAFTQPFSEVRVLILGQDPYPTPGDAMGLAFSVTPETEKLPKSLQNIFKELAVDTGCPPPANGDLTPWASRGVLLLNTALTARAGCAGSHGKLGWQIVVRQIVRALAARKQPLVAILWGKHAAAFLPDLGFTGSERAFARGNATCYVEGEFTGVSAVVSPHPSPLSAHRGFFGSRPFSAANELLTQAGATPINWELPSNSLL
ncbi:MAG: uracil-DNA glycosylase [Microbacteriaceae bacterium]|nr:uracil-DNA glycosylase [Microbacteriaceae bacterium]